MERATDRFLQLSGNAQVCVDPGLSTTIDSDLKKVLSTIMKADDVFAGIMQFAEEGITVGSTTALIPEA